MAVSDESFVLRRANALIGEGREQQRRGRLDRAIELYSKSLRVYPTAEAYTHRVGRTARMGANGIAITLVAPEDELELRGIQRKLSPQSGAPPPEWSCRPPEAAAIR